MTTDSRPGSFGGARLRLARAFRGLSQQELATRASVGHIYISQLETGASREPSQEVLEALGSALGFSRRFFLMGNSDEFDLEHFHFRKLKKTTAGVRDLMISTGSLLDFLIARLSQDVRLPKNTIPVIKADEDDAIERAAEGCRLAWGLDTPITNMMRVIERGGAVATRLDVGEETIDAFSGRGRAPIVVLNTAKKSNSRARWDLAHECGHLVLHSKKYGGKPELEDAADKFAQAFLLPRAAFVREFPVTWRLEWDSVFRIKARWKVSVAAIVRRAYGLKRIDAAEYRRVFKEISRKGWRRGEPEEPADEPPEVLKTALRHYERSRKRHLRDLCGDLGWSNEVFERVTGVAINEPEPTNAVIIPFAASRTKGLLQA